MTDDLRFFVNESSYKESIHSRKHPRCCQEEPLFDFKNPYCDFNVILFVRFTHFKMTDDLRFFVNESFLKMSGWTPEKLKTPEKLWRRLLCFRINHLSLLEKLEVPSRSLQEVFKKPFRSVKYLECSRIPLGHLQSLQNDPRASWSFLMIDHIPESRRCSGRKSWCFQEVFKKSWWTHSVPFRSVQIPYSSRIPLGHLQSLQNDPRDTLAVPMIDHIPESRRCSGRKSRSFTFRSRRIQESRWTRSARHAIFGKGEDFSTPLRVFNFEPIENNSQKP